MTKAHGILFLTDGLDRLPLPGKHVVFHLSEDWLVVGDPCTWDWPHGDPITVAGAEMETVRGQITFDRGIPAVVHSGERITVTPTLTLEALVDQIEAKT